MTCWRESLRRAGAACVACVLVAAPGQVWAQELGNEAGALVVSSSSVYVVLGLSSVALVVLPFGLTTTAGGAAATAAEAAALERYLRENHVEVSEALVLGQGKFVEDLGALLGLDGPGHEELGRVLRAEREVLGALADPAHLTTDRARAFGRALWEAMRADPTLAATLESREG